MTNRIRGKKRKEIIDNWLKGIEDPDIEVKPTKKENRYIVKSKKPVDKSVEDKSVEDKSVKDKSVKDKSVEDKSVQDKSVEDEYEYEYEYEEEPVSQVSQTELLQYEILNELRRMNEEKNKRREEKERKKELKHQIQHQLYKQSMRPEAVSQKSENEVRPIQRRRLNLLRRF